VGGANLSGALTVPHYKGGLLALPINVRLGRNTPAYFCVEEKKVLYDECE